MRLADDSLINRQIGLYYTQQLRQQQQQQHKTAFCAPLPSNPRSLAVQSAATSSRMAKKKGSKKSSGGGGDGDMLKHENVLQAVLLADSFKTFFRPMTLESPKVLLPLVNIPMINYTLEFLATNGVHEVFVLCCAWAELVEEHLKKSVYNRMMKLTVVNCENSFSEGDALRHIEQMHVLKSDFVLISGDVIANIDLKNVLDQHHARRKEDKLNVMTVVLKRAEPNHRTRGYEDRAVVAIDYDTKQMLAFDSDMESLATEMEVSIINEHPRIEFRHDLINTHIYVCALDVLDLLTENFDWQDLQKHLLKGVLGDFVLGNKIHSHTISGEYAARVQDPKSYHSISKDVIQRWTYPMVPEYNLLTDSSYQVQRHNIYKESKVRLSLSCRITCNTVIGSGSIIGENCVLDQCILGRNVRLSEGCVLRNCYIWDNCTLGKGCRVTLSILATDVVLKDGVTVSPNCLIGSKVVVEAKRTVPEFTRLASRFEPTTEEGEEDDDSEVLRNIEAAEEEGREICGGGNPSLVYAPSLEGEPDDKFEESCLAPKTEFQWAKDDDDDDGDEDEEDEEDYFSGNAMRASTMVGGARSPSNGDRGSFENSGSDSKGKQDVEAKLRFEKEMVETLHRGMKNNLDVDAIVLEAGSLKLTHHAILQEYYAAVFHAFFSLTEPPPKEGKKPETRTLLSLKKLLQSWKPVVAKFAKSTDDQKLMLEGLTVCCERYSAYLELVSFTLDQLYEHEILEEDAALDWEDETQNKEILKRAEEFLTFLKEASEEEDDDED